MHGLSSQPGEPRRSGVFSNAVVPFASPSSIIRSLSNLTQFTSTKPTIEARQVSLSKSHLTEAPSPRLRSDTALVLPRFLKARARAAMIG